MGRRGDRGIRTGVVPAHFQRATGKSISLRVMAPRVHCPDITLQTYHLMMGNIRPGISGRMRVYRGNWWGNHGYHHGDQRRVYTTPRKKENRDPGLRSSWLIILVLVFLAACAKVEFQCGLGHCPWAVAEVPCGWSGGPIFWGGGGGGGGGWEVAEVPVVSGWLSAWRQLSVAAVPAEARWHVTDWSSTFNNLLASGLLGTG